MHSGLISCDADLPASEVARLMVTHRVHCVIVRGRSARVPGETRVWGIVSDLDLLQAGVRTDSSRAAGTIAHTPVVTVDPSCPVGDAAEQMLRHRVSHAVVVEADSHHPVGVLSTLDIARRLAGGAT
jgi:signal-transduction protein with cAMP-binding, CBS, and nucleotidyltransferase domain